MSKPDMKKVAEKPKKTMGIPVKEAAENLAKNMKSLSNSLSKVK